MMIQLLKRHSLKIPEFSVYLLLKEYVICSAERYVNLFETDESHCLLNLFKSVVAFKNMTLQEITTIAEEGWLPKGKRQY